MQAAVLAGRRRPARPPPLPRGGGPTSAAPSKPARNTAAPASALTCRGAPPESRASASTALGCRRSRRCPAAASRAVTNRATSSADKGDSGTSTNGFGRHSASAGGPVSTQDPSHAARRASASPSRRSASSHQEDRIALEIWQHSAMSHDAHGPAPILQGASQRMQQQSLAAAGRAEQGDMGRSIRQRGQDPIAGLPPGAVLHGVARTNTQAERGITEVWKVECLHVEWPRGIVRCGGQRGRTAL